MADGDRNGETGAPCVAFGFADAEKAYAHMRCEVLRDYGGSAYGHLLHTWDAGGRVLGRCTRCGGYLLIQSSEYHSFTDAPDGYYTDYFPVSSPAEADALNRRFDGFQIETGFGKRYLMKTDGVLSWSK